MRMVRAGSPAPGYKVYKPAPPANQPGAATVPAHRFEVPIRYEPVAVLGEGAYGVVCSAKKHVPPQEGTSNSLSSSSSVASTSAAGNGVIATSSPSSVPVAIKKITDVFGDLLDARRTARELKILLLLRDANARNVVSLQDAWLSPNAQIATYSDVYVATELYAADFSANITSVRLAERFHTNLAQVAYDVLVALADMHSLGIVHRDIKPANILLGRAFKVEDIASSGTATPMISPLKGSHGASLRPGGLPSGGTSVAALCDLGLAKGGLCGHMDQRRDHTEYVVTRIYRAPELLLLNRYSASVDIWSLGCTLIESWLRQPAFHGTDYIDQIFKIVCGVNVDVSSPSFEHSDPQLKSLLGALVAARGSPLQSQQTLALRLHGSGCTGDEKEFLLSMLPFDGALRPTPVELLKHPFLSGFPRYAPLPNAESLGRQPDFSMDSSQTVHEAQLRRIIWDDLKKAAGPRSVA